MIFGQYGASFFQGAQDRGDELFGRRRQTAMAFQQFKANNPTASYADFQQFVDGMAGGSNYLRGAMPAREVLQQLGQQNQQARRQQELQQRTASLLAGQQAEGAFRNSFAAARMQGVRDPAQLIDMLAEQQGIDRQQDPNSYLTLQQEVERLNPQQVWTQLDEQEFRESLVGIKQGLDVNMFMSEDEIKQRMPMALKGTEHEHRWVANATGMFRQRRAEQRAQIINAALGQVSALGPNASPDAVMGIIETTAKDMFGWDDMPTAEMRQIASEMRETELGERAYRDNERDFSTVQRIAQQLEVALPLVQSNPDGAEEIVRRALRRANPNADESWIEQELPAAMSLVNEQLDYMDDANFAQVQGTAGEQANKALEKGWEIIGGLVDDDTPQNVRHAFAIIQGEGLLVTPTGASLLIEAAAGDLSGKTGAELVEYLQTEAPGSIQDPKSGIEGMLLERQPMRREEYVAELKQDLETNSMAYRERAREAFSLPNRADRMQALDQLGQNIVADIQQLEVQRARLRTEPQKWAKRASSMDEQTFLAVTDDAYRGEIARLNILRQEVMAEREAARRSPGVQAQEEQGAPAPTPRAGAAPMPSGLTGRAAAEAASILRPRAPERNVKSFLAPRGTPDQRMPGDGRNQEWWKGE